MAGMQPCMWEVQRRNVGAGESPNRVQVACPIGQSRRGCYDKNNSSGEFAMCDTLNGQIFREVEVSPQPGTVAFGVASHPPVAHDAWFCADIWTRHASGCCPPQLVTWGRLLERGHVGCCRARSRVHQEAPPLNPTHPAHQHLLLHKQQSTHTHD